MRAAFLIALLSVALVSAGQTPTAPPDPQTASIRGRVVRADNRQPLEDALVWIRSGASTSTDTAGRFEFRNLRAGSVTLTASASGFASAVYGALRPGDAGRTITLAAGQRVQDVSIALQKGAVLAGILIDDHGDPLPLASVVALRRQFAEGEPRLVPLDPIGADSTSDRTDDLGQFRLFGLDAGTYFLAASPPAVSFPIARYINAESVFAFYPGGPARADAQPLTLSAGQDMSGLVFMMPAIKTSTIRGVLSGSSGSQRPSVNVVRHSELGVMTRPVQTSSGGAFTVTAQPPGRYALFVRDGTLVAVSHVVLNDVDITVPLTLRKGATVRGRVVTEAGDPPAGLQPSDVTLYATPTELRSAEVRGSARPDWSFEIAGILPPFRLQPGVRNGWWIKSVGVNGTDATASAFEGDLHDVEVVLTQRPTTLTGTVRNAKGLSGDAVVVVLTEDEDRRWPGSPYVRRLRPERDGRFTLRGLPAARYLAVAVDHLESGEETNPDALERLAREGTRFRMDDGATQAVNLRIVSEP